MNILIVSAHFEPASLTSALRDAAVSQMQADEHKVRVSDLYADGWKAVVDRQDFPILPPSRRLQVAAASGEASASGSLTADVTDEQAKLLWADALILAFPLWWMSMPAILKGWVDRVYSLGFAYGVGEHSATACAGCSPLRPSLTGGRTAATTPSLQLSCDPKLLGQT